jgi:flagellar basal-body rod modification protein FlgD
VAVPSITELESLGLSRDLNAGARRAGGDLGAEDFLKLMITQFKNQDPLKPMESGEFLGQLAQFGTVSGIKDLQGQFEGLSGALVSNQALQASSLLGRDVLVASPAGWLPAGGSLDGAVDLPGGAQNVRLQVFDAAGQLVRTFDLGQSAQGLARFSWDGQTSAGTVAPEGRYTIQAHTLLNGRVQNAAQVLVQAPVESVTIGAGQRGLSLSLRGLGDIPMSDVRQIG